MSGLRERIFSTVSTDSRSEFAPRISPTGIPSSESKWGQLDPTIAPGVSNIEAGERGFDIGEAVVILHAVRGMNIAGGNVVCMMPTRNKPNQIAALTAAAAMFEMISMVAENAAKGANA